MQRRLKAIWRRSRDFRRRSLPPGADDEYAAAQYADHRSPPLAEQRLSMSNEQHRSSIALNSPHAKTGAGIDAYTHHDSSDEKSSDIDRSIAKDFKAYRSVVSAGDPAEASARGIVPSGHSALPSKSHQPAIAPVAGPNGNAASPERDLTKSDSTLASVPELHPDTHKVVDLSNTVDTDVTTTWAPAVTHEVIKPHEHTINQELIHREIHNYEVFHRIQPIYETEILPARHFVQGADGTLVETAEADLPADCTRNFGALQIAERRHSRPQTPEDKPLLREPRIIADETYITPEGFERRETTILHPPELEDMSAYKGPTYPMHFRSADEARV